MAGGRAKWGKVEREGRRRESAEMEMEMGNKAHKAVTPGTYLARAISSLDWCFGSNSVTLPDNVM